MGGPALAYSGGGNTGYATIEMSRAIRAAVTSGRARCCTPGVAGRLQVKEGMRNAFAHTATAAGNVDAGWQPIDNTPMHPEYPCAHRICGAALRARLERTISTPICGI
jgi:hypothetical protein